MPFDNLFAITRVRGRNWSNLYTFYLLPIIILIVGIKLHVTISKSHKSLINALGHGECSNGIFIC
ncbi:hypothetical protein P168DRAFT_121905 [Aspergillus campestris IBT 28561]|uniref:Uncharacterized protein n=1 Tax=Aspergillus campestris (strain IBT 28561) TaxID=1392248 RepID=A0A2I1D649_ASPC2|nr:uncharacterized protein P168DRAFT_121905 [Aspergillus campestris IBT 28561]PKY05351.1 hypothetical protein P168DRAFT_121905 [Aspergillus campestris IBT 28561]